MNVELLEWDSNFFGIKVGKLVLNQIESWDDQNLATWDLIYVFVSPENKAVNSFLKAKNLKIVDEKISFRMDLNQADSQLAKNKNILSYQPGLKDKDLIKIGLQSGIYSRFKVDPKFHNQHFEKLYNTWMQKSINREIANEVFVYQDLQNEMKGVITLKENNKCIEIGILAIDEKFRGQRIGKQFIEEAKRYCLLKGIHCLKVVTQKQNREACSFYTNCGFQESNIVNIYHYWKRKDDTL